MPKATGFDALVWVLPAVAFICGLAALVVVFRRWKREAGEMRDPTDDDRALVAAALSAEERAERSDGRTDFRAGDDEDTGR